MDRHIEWFENIQKTGDRIYFPIPEMFNMDPIIKSYEKGGDTGHLYIVKVPNEKGFKIGSTTQLAIRMYYYPMGTELLFCKKVENLRKKERNWIKSLKKDERFNLYKGKEWFTGNYEDAIEYLDYKNMKKKIHIEVVKNTYEILTPKEARIRRMNIMRKKCIGHYRGFIRGPPVIASL